MTPLDRDVWRRERRLWNEVQMDTLWAPVYDERWGASIDATHREMLGRFLERCPPHARVLDAACGTGKYWRLLLERGCAIVGTDQSAQMLARAHAKHPDVPTRQVGLQEVSESNTFDGVICMDALEIVFPEDWPLVLANFARALHPGGHFYGTVEVETEEHLRVAFAAGQRLGLPLVYGEYAHHGGYHYYPTDEQVRAWLAEAGFALLETAEGEDYRHYLARRQP